MSIIDAIQNFTRTSPSNGLTGDILETLHEEHLTVKKLCSELVDAKSAGERTRILKAIKKALVPHERAEEKVVYQRVAKLKDVESKTLSAEGFLEHEVGDGVVGKLSRMRNKTSPEFTAAAKVLKELLEHHIHEEERDVWEQVRDNFTMDERAKMEREFNAHKKTIKVS